ncbi:hypothetical protein Patl1_20655 [Pistacia atlantica]|uniref:Uncharacterized protein n=2 Tax=Pistacia atlantica TaxID=434234 RepID=A0ACC1BI27_9ROSI|nr:hypothetical protein Patl1_34959 [Pistacia atlantica]KAJ0098685.1 hypothetical protein Patl1_20655 [Pistacia atlantica]
MASIIVGILNPCDYNLSYWNGASIHFDTDGS